MVSSTNGSDNSANQSRYLILERPDRSVVAAVCNGVWADLVNNKLGESLASYEQFDAQSLVPSIERTSQSVITKLESIHDGRQAELGWDRIACGGVVVLTTCQCHCVWLGDTEIYLLRDRRTVKENSSHTLRDAIQRQTNARIDDRFKRILVRSFTSEPIPDFETWELEADDFVGITTGDIPAEIVRTAIDENGLKGTELTQLLTQLSDVVSPRVLHAVVVANAIAD